MQISGTDSEAIEIKIRNVLHEEICKRIEKIVAPKIVFFVGAGISNDPPSNLPLFKRLNEELICLTTARELDEKDREDFASKIRPEIVLQILREILSQQLMDEVLKLIGKIMEKAEPN
ncbi:MAG: hypothetical protein ACK413_03095, partial [Patescibacteria group bacterium]